MKINIKNIFLKQTNFIIFIIISFIYIIKSNNILFLPSIVILCNVLFIYKLYKLNFINNILFKIFIFYNIITLMLPIIYMFLFYNNKDIITYMNEFDISKFDVLKASFIIFLYDIILLISYKIFYKFIKPIYFISKVKLKIKTHYIFIIIYIYMIIVFTKLYLIYMGIWSMHSSFIKLDNNYFIMLIRILSQMDVILLLFFVFKEKNNNLLKIDFILFIIISIISILFAIISESKAKLFFILVPIILFVFYKYKKLFIIGIFIGFLLLSTIFKFMMFQRHYPDKDFIDKIYIYSTTDVKKILAFNKLSVIHKNMILHRLNYQFVIAKVIKLNIHNYKNIYVNNFIGLIPRFIWWNKPKIIVNQNKIGRKLGFLRSDDFTTSFGISPIGEIYYREDLKGIIFIPIFVALFLVILSKLLNEKYFTGYSLSIIIGIKIALLDTYSIILPYTIELFLMYFIIAILLNRKYI